MPSRLTSSAPALMLALAQALLMILGSTTPATAQRVTPAPQASAAAKDFSAAERLLFMHDHLGKLAPPATLGYSFRRSGSLEPGFEDRVALVLKPRADGRCCATHTDFLSADRQLQLPDLPEAEGNPVILHFLEREVREMQRLTKGSQTHFRKRLRMAAYDGATVQPVQLRYRGRVVSGHEVRFSPFLSDPNRPRYEQLARKEYRFLLSDAVPGALLAIRTLVPGADGSTAPLLLEELLADGADPTPTSSETR